MDNIRMEASTAQTKIPGKNILYFHSGRNYKLFFPGKNIFSELGYEEYNDSQRLAEIIHSEDKLIFEEKRKILGTITGKDIYDCKLRLKESTGKWRFFYHRDIVYSNDSAGKPEDYIGIFSEYNDIPETKYAKEGNNISINDISDNKNYNKIMDLEDSDILDLNIIQNLKELGGDEDSSFLKEVINLYLDQAPGLINDIRNAVDENNALKLSRAAHSLKGASLNIGAKKFAEVCKILEFKGRDNDMSDLNSELKDLDEKFSITSDKLLKLTK
jgi:HPt (histidine-containing phosphotransfer) domain-containing protein